MARLVILNRRAKLYTYNKAFIPDIMAVSYPEARKRSWFDAEFAKFKSIYIDNNKICATRYFKRNIFI